MIRVAVAGPPGMLRTGLETLVRGQPDFDLVTIVDSVEEVSGGPSLDVLVALEADLDVLPESLPTVLIRPVIESAQVRAALRAGVRAVMPQDCTASELAAAIQAAAAGLTVLRTADFDLASMALGSEARNAEGASLSPREIEVLRLLADGLANKEIGFRLGISEHTVKFHVNSILTRMNAATRAEAVAIGLRRGLILL